jgi:hypothetical protein
MDSRTDSFASFARLVTECMAHGYRIGYSHGYDDGKSGVYPDPNAVPGAPGTEWANIRDHVPLQRPESAVPDPVVEPRTDTSDDSGD